MERLWAVVALQLTVAAMVEYCAIGAAVAGVILAARSNPFSQVAYGISALIYTWILFKARLYSDFALQIYYVVMAAWGWAVWRKGAGVLNAEATPIRLTTAREAAILSACWAAGTAVLWWFTASYTDAVLPFFDAALTVGSLVGQWLMSRRHLYNWHVWIVLDALYVVLYIDRGLHRTALLFVLLTALACVGLYRWRKEYGQQRVGEALSL